MLLGLNSLLLHDCALLLRECLARLQLCALPRPLRTRYDFDTDHTYSVLRVHLEQSPHPRVSDL